MSFNDYHTNYSGSGVGYPNDHLGINKRVVYEEDLIEEPHRHQHHRRPHYPTETHERVKVVEYEEVPETRYGGVIYQENMETDKYYPRNNRTVWP
ncbi:uncharacterized protein LOC113852841 [Abrus precatorius]|uniref:Uncharacterized protein LOC113852841 n=1 Tax=Abrus precatorius TaxID=3816 RepID=A0A8B8K5I8_ABRPR|nr:uncharacterized protein LOC113852841 [Abrus precatorius]